MNRLGVPLGKGLVWGIVDLSGWSQREQEEKGVRIDNVIVVISEGVTGRGEGASFLYSLGIPCSCCLNL